MPYTPPAPQSPATSKPSSPSISRSQSYHNNYGTTQPKAQDRPGLPRSLSSTYIQRHRRSPSFPQANGTTKPQDAGSEPTAVDQDTTGLSINGSLRQSPPPVRNTLIPPGAIMSPPESPKDGSDDDTPPRGRSARVAKLRDVIRDTIQVRRGQSPTRAEEEENLNAKESRAASVQGHSGLDARSGALSPEARKISHSRSATESAIVNRHGSPMASYSSGQSSEDSDSDEELSIKPTMVRKKSGELVRPALRPSSRRPSSMPGTPTYTKAVHFNEDIEQVRHFLKVDRPIAVSAGTSPVETTFDSESEYPFSSDDSEAYKGSHEWEIRLTNFPSDADERKHMPVRVEQIFLSADQKTLIGSVAVANIAFQKSVAARFTLDYWKTTSEVAAEYDNDIRKQQPDDGYDRFKFNIRLADQANLETKTMFICVRYNVNGQEFWDNNKFTNFQIDFIKKAKAQVPRQSPLGARPIEAIPRSRHSPHVSAGGRVKTSIDDNFDAFTSNRSFSSSWTDDSPSSSIRLKKSSGRKGSIFPGERQHSSSQAFGNRYDFSNSLTAALTHAQNTIGTRNRVEEDEDDNSYFTHKATKSAAPLLVRTPVKTGAPAITSPTPLRDADVRPSLDSEEYKQMLDQMCFFASGTKAPAPTPTSLTQPKPSQVDGASDDGTAIVPRVESKANPGINTSSDPSSKSSGSRTLSGVNSPNLPRSSSPAPKTGGGLGSRTASPVSFGYPYHESNRFAESHMPPAIRS